MLGGLTHTYDIIHKITYIPLHPHKTKKIKKTRAPRRPRAERPWGGHGPVGVQHLQDHVRHAREPAPLRERVERLRLGVCVRGDVAALKARASACGVWGLGRLDVLFHVMDVGEISPSGSRYLLDSQLADQFVKDPPRLHPPEPALGQVLLLVLALRRLLRCNCRRRRRRRWYGRRCHGRRGR